MVERLLRENEVADFLGLGAKTLRKWRREGTGPAYSKIGGRAIRYCPLQLEKYICECEQNPERHITNG